MDVDWAESQAPSAELRIGERVPGWPARLTLAQSPSTQRIGPDVEPDERPPTDGIEEPVGLCSDEACVSARREIGEQQIVKVEFDVDAISVALAHALATVLDGRVLSMPDSAVVRPTAPATTPKGSFWAGAWHADVVLSTIAILVVVVVLLAWTV